MPAAAVRRTIGRRTGKLTRYILPQANAYAMIRRCHDPCRPTRPRLDRADGFAATSRTAAHWKGCGDGDAVEQRAGFGRIEHRPLAAQEIQGSNQSRILTQRDMHVMRQISPPLEQSAVPSIWRRAWVGLICSAAFAGLPVAALAASAANPLYYPCANSSTPPPSDASTIFTSSIGTNGKGGESSSFEGPGHAGDPGGPGSSLSYDVTSSLNAISLFSQGGNGGEGSDAGSGDPAGSSGGGVGTPGGAGGTVAITTTSAQVMLSDPGLLNAALCGSSTGGTGGAAGLSQNNGPRHPSGPGGAGGAVTVTNGSTISAPTESGIIASSTGGNGADGKSQDSFFLNTQGMPAQGAPAVRSRSPTTGPFFPIPPVSSRSAWVGTAAPAEAPETTTAPISRPAVGAMAGRAVP
jgi:hypothetical protein